MSVNDLSHGCQESCQVYQMRSCLKGQDYYIKKNKIYREKSISTIALWCTVQHLLKMAYYFDYLLSLLSKGSCRTLGIYFKQNS